MEERRESASIVFTGDIGFDRYMARKWLDDELLSNGVLEFFRSADHTVANVEGTLINAEDDGSRGVFFHSMDPDAVMLFRKIGADIWSIGNNHTMDAGAEGIVSTKRIATAEGAQTVGAGLNIDEASEPVYLCEAGGIGMFCVSYMAECIPATETEAGIFRWDDEERVERRIREIKERCRWCVIIAHGGEEFAAMPNPYTRDRYIKYLELGADVVVSHHPHVPENYELFPDGKMIFYSLGNFIFDTDYQRAHKYTDKGVLLKLNFSKDSISFDAIGLSLDRERERISDAPLPVIFTNITDEHYRALSPLSAKAFIAEEMRKMIYLEPHRFKDATDTVWNSYFFSTEPDGYFEGAHMDLALIVKLTETLDESAVAACPLEDVKAYIRSML